jgi:hypothetical protein
MISYYEKSYKYCSEINYQDYESCFHIHDNFSIVIGKKYKFNYNLLDFCSVYNCYMNNTKMVTNICLGSTEESIIYLEGEHKLNEDDYIKNELVIKVESIFIFYDDLLDITQKNLLILRPQDKKVKFI